MELRNDHFHSGLDIKTNGVEGLPVFAVKDGYVSRIKVSPWGYGKALYLQHPDGTTTVYGHLQRYAASIAAYTLDAQYAAKDFAIDNYPERDRLPVKQGDLIAWSGNSGGSGGAHLHFEIRNAEQYALDPEAYGIELKDGLPPELKGVRIYPLSADTRTMPYPGTAKGFALEKGAKSYRLKQDTIAAFGTVAFALHVIDKYNGSDNACGPRKIDLYVDDVKAFSVDLDHIDFGLQRYCNAYTDYALQKDQDMHYHRLYKLPNNKLDLYGDEPMQGRVETTPGRDQRIRMVATDANGNSSELGFVLHGATALEASTWARPPATGTRMEQGKENNFSADGVRLTLPADALYEDLDFHYTSKPKPARAHSQLHTLQDKLTPMHVASALSIRADSLPEALRSKALILRWEENGKHAVQGGTWENGWVRTTVKSFGSYCVVVDSVPPKITPIGLKASMKGRSGFALRVADNLSGLEKWVATLDGEWILMDFDPKSRSLSHTFDKHTNGPGTHLLKVEVQDERGNKSSYSFTFTR
ncbi:MAG: M23 family metallopeptidase [Flavobacteriales bacterium]